MNGITSYSGSNRINDKWRKITEEVPKLTEEKLRVIIAYRTGKNIEKVKIKNVYDVGGENGL